MTGKTGADYEGRSGSDPRVVEQEAPGGTISAAAKPPPAEHISNLANYNNLCDIILAETIKSYLL